MRKTILLFILFALPLLGMAQSKSITINWGNNSSGVPDFGGKESSDDKNFDPLKLQLSKETVQYTTQWVDGDFADENSLTVTNVRFGVVSSEELKK